MIKQGTRVAVLVTTLSLLLPIDSAAQSLVAAVLPSSRSVRVGTSATAFATVINTEGNPATACGIAPLTSIPATFSFQATNPSTNQPIGIPNSPINIPANASQTFVLSITPTAPFGATEIEFSFACSNAPAATPIRGLNTLLLSASATPVPDIVALVATLTNDGISNIDSDNRLGVFSVATVNVGTSGLITASADTGGANLSINVTICQTSPSTGTCLASPRSTVTTPINASATATFGVFLQAQRPVPFDPAVSRIFVRFRDASGSVRGSTSVAVRDLAPVLFRVQEFFAEASFKGFSAPQWATLHAEAFQRRRLRPSPFEQVGGAIVGFDASLDDFCNVAAPSIPCVDAEVRLSTAAVYSWDLASVSKARGAISQVFIGVGGTATASPDSLLEPVILTFTSNMFLRVFPFDPRAGIVTLQQTNNGTEGTIIISRDTGASCTTGNCSDSIRFMIDGSLPGIGTLTFINEGTSGLEFVPPVPEGSTSRGVLLSSGAIITTSSGMITLP